MDIQKAIIVIVITLVVVILFNVGIYAYVKKRGPHVNTFGRIYQRARHPWKEDEEKLKELSEKVAKLKDRSERNHNNAGNRPIQD